MVIERLEPGSEQALALLSTYRGELTAVFGTDPTAGVSADPEELTPPRGDFLVVRDNDGTAIGCGGVKVIAPGTAEIKRMWVSPAARGRGVGSALLAALEAAARDLGATRAVLDTHADLASALRLYERAGWSPVEPYNDNPYATHWFAKQLA